MIEDRFTGGQRIGGGSFDVRATGILNPVDFTRHGSNERLILDPSTGDCGAILPPGDDQLRSQMRYWRPSWGSLVNMAPDSSRPAS